MRLLSWAVLMAAAGTELVSATATSIIDASPSSSACAEPATRFHLTDPPYDNYFYSDCHSASQVVVTSPLPESNLTLIGPRLLVAWPAGNSGVVTFFAPRNGINGSLIISLENFTTGVEIEPIYERVNDDEPVVGVSGLLNLNSSATLTVAILGSIRSIRDFTEGPSLLQPSIQNATQFSTTSAGTAIIDRLWLDNVTTTTLTFSPVSDDGAIQLNNQTLDFTEGIYQFNASFNYPQLDQLSTTEVLNAESQTLIAQNPDQAQSLSFLSYSDKLLAGAWRFLTYFGRDSMISLLLMESVLSPGEHGAMEAVLGAVLERINRTDGSVAHEETIGDYATFLNLQENLTSTAPGYDYKMIDSDYFLPIALADYFLKNKVGQERAPVFLNTSASVNPKNNGLTYQQLAVLTAEKIMKQTAAFSAPAGQVKENLIHLKEDQIVGEWRDSTYGIGGGRIPYDVNTALVPAALRAIAALAGAGFFPQHPEWADVASQYAQVWEDETLRFFEVTVSESDAQTLVEAYVSDNNMPFPSHSNLINSSVSFYGLALDGNDNQTLVRVMNTDDCFRHFLINATNQTQLSAFLSQTADHILAPFPVGLSTDVGLLVANPAYGGDPVYAANFTNSAYHGTVVWSWQLAMMAVGLERQLSRCADGMPPDFCADPVLHSKIVAAYRYLWDLIDANSELLSGEVWSWRYDGDMFVTTPLGSLPPPPGTNPTESDIRQLWSLTFLAAERDEGVV